MADASAESTKKKYRLRKPDTRDRSEELKIKYYKDPENQKNLRERIAKYKDGIKDLEEKIADLEKFIFDILPEETLR